jgi:diacylglycerol kinase (ATP)
MKSVKPSNEFERLIRAFGYSWQGLKAASMHPAFRYELIAAAVMIPLALVLEHGPLKRAILIGSILLVLIVELLNTGIEAAIDRISPEWHELSGRAKDIGSAAVLLSLLNAGIVWLLILF